VSLPKETAYLEVQITRLCELLGEHIQATESNVERKQARTGEEILADLVDEKVEVIDTAEDDAESVSSNESEIYNPLQLPLGWDGKPIPYWLYKLHGLNISYSCEICGNYQYRGRRAFERHFQEWRHQHGMRCLRIPNLKAFHEITQIEDAKSLWEKIQKEEEALAFKVENEEEFEDAEGNVFNRKTFEDLRRQGLI